MSLKNSKKIIFLVFIIFPSFLIIGAASGIIIHYYFLETPIIPILPGILSERINIPLDFVNLEVSQFSLETQNYLLFQNFEPFPPLTFPKLVQILGILIGILISLGLALISGFKRLPFFISMGILIFLFTLSGVNALNIGGISSNVPLIILLSGLILPATLLHTFFTHWTLSQRALVIVPVALMTWTTLLYTAEAVFPTLLLSENITLLALAISGLFILYIGQSVISNVFELLSRLNKGLSIKISWHLTIFFVLYLGFLVLYLLKLTGDPVPGIPLPPLYLLFILVGILGLLETNRKFVQTQQVYWEPIIGQGLYLIGFAISLLVFLKAEVTLNTPMVDFLEHIFIYSQIGFSLMFFIYLMINFSEIMNSGTAVYKIIYQPPFFPYIHMRFGALLCLLILLVYADAIISVQFSTASTNISADYYYATDRPREASILYENSYDRYRRNKKALYSVSHLAFQQNQPTIALNTLIRSFDENPNLPDILLLSSTLHKRGRLTEAIFYLEEGLKYFPDQPYLLNNLGLLYSKINKPEEAYVLFEQMEGEKKIGQANQVGLQAKHLINFDKFAPVENNPIAQINQLAQYNLKGDFAPFHLKTDTITTSLIINRALIRNQWSNDVENEIKDDLAILDSLIADSFLPSVEEEIRESKVVRYYQENYINDALKALNGLAFNFRNNSGFYHSFAANILIAQLDFEKAAIELSQAEENGFTKIQPRHLPVLFFGNMENHARDLAEKYEMEFPDWMNREKNNEETANDSLLFFKTLSTLHASQRKEFWPPLQEIESPALKAYYALQLLMRKAHWLNEGEITFLVKTIKENGTEKDNTPLLDVLAQMLVEKDVSAVQKNERLNHFLGKGKPLYRNAYWTSLVVLSLEDDSGDEEKYNLLQEATDFSKDPLLWINLVKYSRKIGLDHYASTSLALMSEWIDPEDLVQLQLDHL